jgi:hypothetical protein
MLGAADNAAIRSAIGLGQTDAPTFLAQSLTGQSLTGTQATSLVNMAATWNTTGTPTALQLNVTDTASNAASKLMDLQVGGVSKFKVEKTGSLNIANGSFLLRDNVSGANEMRFLNNGLVFRAINEALVLKMSTGGMWVHTDKYIGFGDAIGTLPDTTFFQDAAGILAQRNGTAAQAFRVYNAYYGTTADEWLEIDWKTTVGTVKIGANKGATGGARALALSIEGTPVFGLSSNNSASSAWWSIQRNGHLFCNPDNTYDIGASGANRPRSIYVVNAYPSNIELQNNNASYAWVGRGGISAPSDGVIRLSDTANANFNRLQLGGTTSAFPAIKRNGTGIDIKLADDSAFAPIKGKITTDTNYTAGVPSATGYITIYDATGTAYRVPCTV